MKRPGVVFTPEAEEQLAELYRYIEENATAERRTGLRGRCRRILRRSGDIPSARHTA